MARDDSAIAAGSVRPCASSACVGHAAATGGSRDPSPSSANAAPTVQLLRAGEPLVDPTYRFAHTSHAGADLVATRSQL